MAASFPAPPWHLSGWGAQALYLTDIDVARRHVPADLRIVQVLPGKTLSTLYFAEYDAGTLQYHELIFGVGLVLLERRLRFYIPQLFVDDARSVAGGRFNWNLPKDFADFVVQRSARNFQVRVRDGNDLVCEIAGDRLRWVLPMKAPVPALGEDAKSFFPFTGALTALTGPARIRCRLPQDSTFAPALRTHVAGWHYRTLSLAIPPAHQVVRHTGGTT